MMSRCGPNKANGPLGEHSQSTRLWIHGTIIIQWNAFWQEGTFNQLEEVVVHSECLPSMYFAWGASLAEVRKEALTVNSP